MPSSPTNLNYPEYVTKYSMNFDEKGCLTNIDAVKVIDNRAYTVIIVYKKKLRELVYNKL